MPKVSISSYIIWSNSDKNGFKTIEDWPSIRYCVRFASASIDGSDETALLAYTKYGKRGSLRPNFMHLALLDICTSDLVFTEAFAYMQ